MRVLKRFMPDVRLDRGVSRPALAVACLLVLIRVAASIVCAACFYDFEDSKTRSFHLHAGDDHDPCHHGKAEVDPLTAWACLASKDEPGFVLPDIPRLPVLVSFFTPLFLPAFSYPGRPLVAAHGRGPPFLAH